MYRLLLALFVLLVSNASADDNPCLTFKPASLTNAGSEVAQYVANRKLLWNPGETIRVRFLEGSDRLQSRVMKYAEKWELYGNFDFQHVESGPAEIRVAFGGKGDQRKRSGSWSYVGTDSKRIANQSLPTMNFGWLSDSSTDKRVREVVLHEFGHALGLRHEQANPRSAIPWDHDKAFAYFKRNNPGWENDDVVRNVLATLDPSQVPLGKDWDAYSIMQYAIPRTITRGGFQVDWNTELSSQDKIYIARLYPKTTDPVFDASYGRYLSSPLNSHLVTRRIAGFNEDRLGDGELKKVYGENIVKISHNDCIRGICNTHEYIAHLIYENGSTWMIVNDGDRETRTEISDDDSIRGFHWDRADQRIWYVRFSAGKSRLHSRKLKNGVLGKVYGENVTFLDDADTFRGFHINQKRDRIWLVRYLRDSESEYKTRLYSHSFDSGVPDGRRLSKIQGKDVLDLDQADTFRGWSFLRRQ